MYKDRIKIENNNLQIDYKNLFVNNEINEKNENNTDLQIDYKSYKINI